MKQLRATLLAIFSCALAATAFAASVDYFLKIPGIPGESTDSNHKDWIIIDSMSVDKDVATPRDAASGMATGKRQHKPFVVTKPVDKASPQLAKMCAAGTVLKEVEVGGPGVRYKLKDVIISSIQPSSGGDRPMETLSLNFAKIEFSAKDTKEAARESVQRATSKDAKAKPERAP
jgi:type VI secretion system secreted protein Hcp